MPNYGRDGDLMWDSRNLIIWTVAESNVGIIAANLPCLKPLFRSMLVSTDEKGSRKASHHSDACAQGIKSRSAVKSYGPLASDKALDSEFLVYGPAGKAYMLTTIDATKDKAGYITEISSGRSSPAAGRSSNESETMLNCKAPASSGVHNITVTTKVDVTESLHSQEGCESGEIHSRPQAKEML